MLSRQEEEQERRETLANDLKVLEAQRGSTFHQHGLAQANELSGGRFGATGAPVVIASKPNPSSQYPACSPALAVELPPEPPLGFGNPALEPSADLSAVEQLPDSAPAAAASNDAPLLPDAVQRGAESGPSPDGERDA